MLYCSINLQYYYCNGIVIQSDKESMMAETAYFPTTFTDTPEYLYYDDFSHDQAAAAAYLQLATRGLRVVSGLQPNKVADLTTISLQEGTLEFCPNDIEKRWTDIPTAERQLAKDGGRAVFRLEDENEQTAAFGWIGASSDEERAYLPMCTNTFALRVNEHFRGQRLATPFSRLIVAGAGARHGAHDIGLETWGSNTAAVRSYLGAGALLVTTAHDRRKTRRPELQDNEGKVHDVRLYMRFPQSASFYPQVPR
jgi:hypothetical protein